MKRPPLTELDYRTHYVAAYLSLQLGTADECIDWARDMVEAGRETEHILILASCEKQASHFDVDLFLSNALKEIGYPQKKSDDLGDCHGSYYVYKVAYGEVAKANLVKLGEHARLVGGKLQDFEYLYWAGEPLEWEHITYEYWPGSSPEEIEELIVQQAQQWLTDNEQMLRLK